MHTHESRSQRALRSHVLDAYNRAFYADRDPKRPLFPPRFKSLIWKSFAFTKGKIRKGPNHVPKRLSERDSFSCEQAQWHNARRTYGRLGRKSITQSPGRFIKGTTSWEIMCSSISIYQFLAPFPLVFTHRSTREGRGYGPLVHLFHFIFCPQVFS